MGEREDFIVHGLDPDFHGLHPIFLEQGESLFIQGIGSGGDTNGIDQARGEAGLSFFEIMNLILSTDCRETSAVKGNLFFTALAIFGDSSKSGFNKGTNGSGRGVAFKRCLLVAEETTVTATYRGKKNRDNEWSHLAIISNYKISR
jgi:hypothetical protein